MNKTKRKYYCIDCDKEISWQSALYGQGRCRSCRQRGNLNNRYNSERHKIYYCKEIDCNNEISYRNWKDGQGRCKSCMQKGKLNSTKRLEVRIKMSDARKNKTYEEFYGIEKAKKVKDLLSENRMGNKNHFFGKPIKPRWGKYKGINMRSSWEIKYAKYLDKLGINWLYEPKAFNLGDTTYTPDFKLLDNVYVEIKGYMSETAYFKIKKFLEQYPNIKLQLLMYKDLQRMGVLKDN